MYVDLHLLHESTVFPFLTLRGVYRARDPSTMCTDMYSTVGSFLLTLVIMYHDICKYHDIYIDMIPTCICYGLCNTSVMYTCTCMYDTSMFSYIL